MHGVVHKLLSLQNTINSVCVSEGPKKAIRDGE
jgi:hypothetical protein